MIVVTFALPQESGVFRRTLRRAGGRLGGEEIRVAHIGVGPAAAGEQTRRLLAGETSALKTGETLRMLICAGFAGGLDPALRAGDLVIGENFSAPDLLVRARVAAAGNSRYFWGELVTRDTPLETAIAKAALFQKTGALAVDMETSAVAETCRAAALPLLAVRAISDRAHTPLPVPMDHWFDLDRQRPRPLRLLGFLSQNPAQILPFVSFLRSLLTARRALADFLARFLAQPPGF